MSERDRFDEETRRQGLTLSDEELNNIRSTVLWVKGELAARSGRITDDIEPPYRFVPTRRTGDGRFRPSFARPSGWLDSVDVRTPYHSHCGSPFCSPPRSARGTLPSSPRIFWKLPGPGGLPALSSAAPLHSP